MTGHTALQNIHLTFEGRQVQVGHTALYYVGTAVIPAKRLAEGSIQLINQKRPESCLHKAGTQSTTACTYLNKGWSAHPTKSAGRAQKKFDTAGRLIDGRAYPIIQYPMDAIIASLHRFEAECDTELLTLKGQITALRAENERLRELAEAAAASAVEAPPARADGEAGAGAGAGAGTRIRYDRTLDFVFDPDRLYPKNVRGAHTALFRNLVTEYRKDPTKFRISGIGHRSKGEDQPHFIVSHDTLTSRGAYFCVEYHLYYIQSAVTDKPTYTHITCKDASGYYATLAYFVLPGPGY